MRTTLTIEDHLAAALKEKAFRSGKSFKQVVNESIARGLEEERPQTKRKKRYKLKTFDMGEPYVDLTKALRIAGELEDEEIIRKMELRK